MIAILEAKRAGLLSKKYWLPNIVAGIIVGVVALPLAMAFAIASGVKPEQGIYTAIVAGLAVSLLGGSRVQVAGPTGAFIVILSGIVAQHGLEGLQIATLMAGIILFILGITRMGGVIKFIPVPVVVGFTAGIGIIIWVGQWKDFFGLPEASGEYFHQQLWSLLQAFPSLDPTTSCLAVVALALLIAIPKIKGMERVPGPLVALIVLSGAQAYFQFDSVATIGSAFGEIPRGLPGFALPEITVTRVLSLIGPAFAIAMLGAIESLLSAVVADGMCRTRHHSNQELIGQGVANVLSPMFGGIAATGAIARTATSIRNGGNSPIAGIVHVIVLVLVVLVLAPLAVYIPLACLAAILFMVAWNMSQPKLVWRMIKESTRSDVVILLITLVLTVFVNLVIAVNIGVVLAMLHFLKRMSSGMKVKKLTTVQQRLVLEEPSLVDEEKAEQIAVVSIEGPFFYAGIDYIEQELRMAAKDARVLILELSHASMLDGTALQMLEKIILDLQEQGTQVFLCELNASFKRKLNRLSLWRRLGYQVLYDKLAPALEAAYCYIDTVVAKEPELNDETKLAAEFKPA